MKDKKTYNSLNEYVSSGQYFTDAKLWYETKYVYPFTQRSFMIIITTIMLVVLISITFNTYNMFPTILQVKYSISAQVSSNKSAQIIRADQIQNDALASVSDIMIRNYVTKRESYSFSDLKLQFTYVKNNSTRIMFRRFYNNMSIDNPSSPVLKYKQFAKRYVKILNATYLDKGKAQVKFLSTVKNENGELVENIVWLATIGYEIDKINPYLPSGTRFNFTVTNYEVKLLEDKLKK